MSEAIESKKKVETDKNLNSQMFLKGGQFLTLTEKN